MREFFTYSLADDWRCNRGEFDFQLFYFIGWKSALKLMSIGLFKVGCKLRHRLLIVDRLSFQEKHPEVFI